MKLKTFMKKMKLKRDEELLIRFVLNGVEIPHPSERDEDYINDLIKKFNPPITKMELNDKKQIILNVELVK